jgi:cell division protein FtsL
MDDREYQAYIDRYKMQLGVLKTKQSQKDKASTEVSRLKVESDILIKSEKVLKALIDKLAMKDLSKMDKLVTYGLNTVFHDRNVEFSSKVV